MKFLYTFLTLILVTRITAVELPVLNLSHTFKSYFSINDKYLPVEKMNEKIAASLRIKLNQYFTIGLATNFNLARSYIVSNIDNSYQVSTTLSSFNIYVAPLKGMQFAFSVKPQYGIDNSCFKSLASTAFSYHTKKFRFNTQYTNGYNSTSNASMSHRVLASFSFKSGTKYFGFHTFKTSALMNHNDLILQNSNFNLRSIECTYELRLDLNELFEDIDIVCTDE